MGRLLLEVHTDDKTSDERLRELTPFGYKGRPEFYVTEYVVRGPGRKYPAMIHVVSDSPMIPVLLLSTKLFNWRNDIQELLKKRQWMITCDCTFHVVPQLTEEV